jgi:3-oxoacyl-[acyl-carrier-protein] synthase II
MSIGEAAAFLVVEDAEHAQARGAQSHGELLGAGMTTDAHHVTAPHPDGEGMVEAIRLALERAGLPPQAVGYVNAHGTGTPQNDRVEALALRQVFGEGGVLLSSTKSLVGHTMAAAGSLEAVATLLAIQHGLLPPTANLAVVDPEIPFDCLARAARPAAVDRALSNSFGFGGQNVSLLFGKSES